MTQTTARKFVNEVKRWVRAEEATNIWVKCASGERWDLRCDVHFSPDCIYIVDDEWAELRKAQADGKQLRHYCSDESRWCDQPLEEIHWNHGNPAEWRIKSEVKFPVYFLSEATDTIYRFDDEETATAVITDDSKTTIGKKYPLHIRYCNTDRWRKLNTVTIEGITYCDTQPVWAWDGDSSVRYVKFIDAVNKTVFNIGGERHGAAYDHYAPIEYIDDWMIEVWKKLKI